MKCVIWLDEIQNLTSSEIHKLQHALKNTCSHFTRTARIQLIISGVHVALLRAESPSDEDWQKINTSTGGIHLVNLEPLSFKSAHRMLQELLRAEGNANAGALMEERSVIECLRWVGKYSNSCNHAANVTTGGFPRMIEWLARKVAPLNMELNNAASLLKLIQAKCQHMYPTRTEHPGNYLQLIAVACLTRQKLTLGATLSNVC